MLIVATAGHIDHGKTSLVRALTGVDTDKLPEERARGISIDLGFAYWEAEPGVLVAFVDVPGHHRFVRNMLAGVAAIHYAMLVVAVDDGVMPQTIEHVQILDFLGIRQGVIVLSKSDMAPPERAVEVEAGVRQMLAGTSLADIPAIAVSARTGAGVAELKALLAQTARQHEATRGAGAKSEHRARFAIDRVFSVKGAGTVVTGTVYDGQIAVDDRLVVAPGNAQVRVRGIQVHGRQVQRCGSGERAAVNITGVQPADVARGAWLADPAIPLAGVLMDVSLTLLPTATPLRHAGPARLYLGASEVNCRVLLRGKGQLEPGQRAAVRVQLERTLLAVNGDRFVLRDGPGSHTLGGGFIVDPWPAARRKMLDAQEFDALATGVPETALAAMLQARPGAGIELTRFERIFNITEARRDAALQACEAVALGKAHPVVVRRSYVDDATTRVAEALKQDQRTAVPIAELRDAVAPELSAEAFDFLLRAQAERLDVSLAGGSVTLRERRETARSSDVAAWERVRPVIVQFWLQPTDLAELSRLSQVPVGRLRAILHTQARVGDIFALQPDKYIVRELAAQLAAAAAETAAKFPEGKFSAAQYRDRIGTGRTLAIHILEMLDVIGVTRRTGDLRTIVRSPESVFGATTSFIALKTSAAPAPAAPKSSRPAPPSRHAPTRR